MAKNNKNIQQSNDSDYDVKKNLSRISPYRTHKKTGDENTSSEYKNSNYRPRNISSNDILNEQITGEYSFSQQYYRLEDQISNYSDRNETAHDSLRKEFDGKIDKLSDQIKEKLSTSWFKWIIGGLVAAIITIGSIWFSLSYSVVLQSGNESSKKLNGLEMESDRHSNELQNIRKEIENIQSDKHVPNR